MEHQAAFLKFLKPRAQNETGVAASAQMEETILSVSTEKKVPKEKIEKKTWHTEHETDIAVIGMEGLFPEASNVEEFWQHLRNKTDLIREIPEDHFDYHPWFHPDKECADSMYCKWGSFIQDVDKFDASFFNIAREKLN